MWRPVLASATLCSLLLLAACGGGSTTHSGTQATPGGLSAASTLAASSPSASVTPGATPSLTPVGSPNQIPIAAPNVRQLTIGDSSLNPTNITATATQPVELQVTNESSTPCSFSIDGFTQPQTIQPHQSATITFSVTGAATQDRTMGCQGSSSRQGTFRLEYTGILPAGR
jgi:hypothetical protein